MQVKDIMNTDVEYVNEGTSVKEVSRLIFGRGINGVPVVDSKKRLVGFITEKDILAKFFPSVQEYMEDPVNTSDFEKMEGKIEDVFDFPASRIMSKSPVTVSADMPLLRAYSLMTTQKIGRLPVVDRDDSLVGIVSKGDIFRAVVAGKIPYVENEEYHDWLSRHYDQVVQWSQRLSHEVPDLVTLFKANKVRKVLDVGSGTGSHDIALAEKKFQVWGIERSRQMYQTSREKKEKVLMQFRNNVEFLNADYVDILKNQKGIYDAAIFMGNALSHNPNDYKKILESVHKALRKEGVLVLQIANLNKIFRVSKRLQDFNIASSKMGQGREVAFIEYFNAPRKRGDNATLNMAILGFDGKRWAPKSVNSTPIAYFDEDSIRKLLKQIGFKKIESYGSRFLGRLFREKFNPRESDWLNVVAKR